MDFRRKSLPGIQELMKIDIDGKVGKLVGLISKRIAERSDVVGRMKKILNDWETEIIRLNQLDGEIDAYEMMVLEEAGKCDIVDEIVKGARMAAEEKVKHIKSVMLEKGMDSGIPPRVPYAPWGGR